MMRAVVVALLLVECLHLAGAARVDIIDGETVTDLNLVNTSARSNLSGEEVYANVYSIGHHWSARAVNAVLRAGGAYHIAIEAFGTEFGYGYTPFHSPAISTCVPKNDPQHTFYGSYKIGEVNMDGTEFLEVVNSMRPRWLGDEYDLLSQNCVSFSDALVKELFGEEAGLPGWMSRLMRIGSVVLPPLGKAGHASSRSSNAVSEGGKEGLKSSAAAVEWSRSNPEQIQQWQHNQQVRPQYPNYPRYPLYPQGQYGQYRQGGGVVPGRRY